MNTKFKGIYDNSKSVYITNTTGGRGYGKTKQGIDDLRKQNKELKEQILLLKASEPMLEFAKQTYKDNWNKLKEYITKEQARIVIENTNEDEFIYTDLLIKMQEIEGGMNECI